MSATGPRRLRVLITTDTVGGVWDFSLTLGQYLLSRGHHVLLAVIGDPPDAGRASLPDGMEVEQRSARLEWMRDGLADLEGTAIWLQRLCERWGPDLLHLNQMGYSGVARFGVPTLVVVHSDVCSWFHEVDRGPLPAGWEPYRAAVRDGLRGADRVVAPSRYQADLTERFFGRRVDAVIHNATRAVRPPSYTAQPDRAAHSDESPLVLAVGRAWDRAKGIEPLDAALELLGPDAPAAHLLGALAGPDGEVFHPRRLHCHGNQPPGEVAAWMDRASIFVSPSRYEPFGLAALEAARRNCALLLSDIGSYRELWDGAAEFFRPGSVEELAERLYALSRDPTRRDELGAAAAERAARYTWPDFGSAYEREYLSAASRPVAPHQTERQHASRACAASLLENRCT